MDIFGREPKENSRFPESLPASSESSFFHQSGMEADHEEYRHRNDKTRHASESFPDPGAALAAARSAFIRSVPSRAPLHARSRPEVVREARSLHWHAAIGRLRWRR